MSNVPCNKYCMNFDAKYSTSTDFNVSNNIYTYFVFFKGFECFFYHTLMIRAKQYTTLKSHMSIPQNL